MDSVWNEKVDPPKNWLRRARVQAVPVGDTLVETDVVAVAK